MIDRETLIKISKMNNLRPWQQEKHYIQSLILVSLSEYSLVFKGGTYLWFFHGLNRFSEDLDFTATNTVPEELDVRVSDTLNLFGVENSIKTISKDDRSYSFRVGANGPLHTSEKDICHCYVEISRREQVVLQPQRMQLLFDAYQIPTKIISGMALEEVVAEKVRALYNRNKARDLYDLYIIITEKNIKFDKNLINKKLEYYKTSFSYEKFVDKMDEKKKSWNAEIKSLIFGRMPEFDSVISTIEKWAKE